jgi:hypothetical protein
MNNVMTVRSFEFFRDQPTLDCSIMIPSMDERSKQAQSQKGRRVRCGQNLTQVLVKALQLGCSSDAAQCALFTISGGTAAAVESRFVADAAFLDMANEIKAPGFPRFSREEKFVCLGVSNVRAQCDNLLNFPQQVVWWWSGSRCFVQHLRAGTVQSSFGFLSGTG